MRKIEFRIKHGIENRWIYGYPVFYDDGSFTFIDKEPLNNLYPLDMCEITCAYDRTLGQYTGLKDKNGTKIFEGDIVSFDEKEWGSKYIEVVKWDYSLLDMRKSDYKQWCEVIGNIYDNPELLEGIRNENK